MSKPFNFNYSELCNCKDSLNEDIESVLSLEVKRLNKDTILPTRAHPFDAGLDIYSNEDVFIPLGTTVKVSTGIAVNIPPGYYGRINDRSSMAIKGLRTGAGVVDTGYQGELSIILHNLNHIGDDDGYLITKGDRIAQLVIQKIELPIVKEVDSFEESERGSNGYGSTGM
jgi:dUTP pyrophosphatase